MAGHRLAGEENACRLWNLGVLAREVAALRPSENGPLDGWVERQLPGAATRPRGEDTG